MDWIVIELEIYWTFNIEHLINGEYDCSSVYVFYHFFNNLDGFLVVNKKSRAVKR